MAQQTSFLLLAREAELGASCWNVENGVEGVGRDVQTRKERQDHELFPT
jgi:predicted small secreted protein